MQQCCQKWLQVKRYCLIHGSLRPLWSKEKVNMHFRSQEMCILYTQVITNVTFKIFGIQYADYSRQIMDTQCIL